MTQKFPTEALACLERVHGASFDLERLRDQLLYFWKGPWKGEGNLWTIWMQTFRLFAEWAELYKLICLVATLGVMPLRTEDKEYVCNFGD